MLKEGHFCQGDDRFCYGKRARVSCGMYLIDGKSLRLCGACVERMTKPKQEKKETEDVA